MAFLNMLKSFPNFKLDFQYQYIKQRFNFTHPFSWMNQDAFGSYYTVFNLIGARGACMNLFSTTSAKRSSSGR